MFPYSFNPYGVASYNTSDAEYLRALAEEQAARQAYTEAVRAQAEARARAARARQQRQAIERPYSAYFSDEDEDDSSSSGGYHRRRPTYGSLPSRGIFEGQRRRELELEQRRRQEALELERAQEQERIRQLEEEQRKRLSEEEQQRQAMLEDELLRQKEAEQRGREMRRRLQEEYRRRQSLSPLEELLGLRPSRSMQSDPEPFRTRRARTTSPPVMRRTQPTPSSPAAMRASTSHTSPTPPPKVTTPPPSAAEVAAATKIQKTWRTYAQRRAALASLERISAAFEASKSAFTLPAKLDYQRTPGDTAQSVSVPTTCVVIASVPVQEADSETEAEEQAPKLAYTPNNAPLHAYEEELNQMLTQLDEVQSGGDADVRARRRELVRTIEREADYVERVKVAVWEAWQEKETMSEEEKEVEMTVAPDPTETHPLELDSMSSPPLATTSSEADDSDASLDTPERSYTHLQADPVAQSPPHAHEISVGNEHTETDSHPSPQKRQSTTADLLSSLYPLYNQDWDDVDPWDLF
ncbi:hypothetical protein EIP86_004655 [Pleurotus ostreatoroseus]|nr:hypothetical protein EIP86_004655 [Pleurotus ostreatoroseus]